MREYLHVHFTQTVQFAEPLSFNTKPLRQNHYCWAYGHDYNYTFFSAKTIIWSFNPGAINLTVYFTLPTIYKLIIQENIRGWVTSPHWNSGAHGCRNLWSSFKKKKLLTSFFLFLLLSVGYTGKKKMYFQLRDKPSKRFSFQGKIRFHSHFILWNASALWCSSSG